MADFDIEKIVKSVVSEMAAGQQPAGTKFVPDPPPAHEAVNRKDDVKHVAIGSDHTAVAQKRIIATYLTSLGYHVTDVGPATKDRVDYPDFAVAVAKKVASGECERDIPRASEYALLLHRSDRS